MAVNKSRLINQFKELVEIDSLSFHEGQMADYLQALYESLGIEATEDDSGKITGSDAGNIFASIQGDPEAEPVLFVSHMDTVAPGIGKVAIVHEDGTITSDGTTILGADDAAATAIIIEAIRELQEEGTAHRTIELLHPTAEEAYTIGASNFDYSRVTAKRAYCLDCSDRLGAYSAQEPTLIQFRFTIRGKAAHAGFEPESGINTIAAAAAAIARIPQGRPNDHSTFNFGTIQGGVTTNVVPEKTIIEGELRSAVHEDALKLYENAATIFQEEAEKIGASFTAEKTVRLTAYKIAETSPALQAYIAALRKNGIEPYAKPNFGGSDNNVLMRNGIDGICVFNSMHECHTTREYAKVDELVAMVKVVKELMKV